MGGLTSEGTTLSLTSHSEITKIRTALADVEAFLVAQGLASGWIEDICLVLAEAMTNIARHGYKEEIGNIRLSLTLDEGCLNCKLVDSGIAFDPSELGHVLPDPRMLQEGGYGWFIIRNLTEGLQYSHEKGYNCLKFSVPVSSPA